jgi:RND family efflux transporter MFP subunit
MKISTAHHQKTRLILGICFAVLLSAGVTAFLALNIHSSNERETASRKKMANSGPKVETSAVKQSPTERDLLLVGEARAYYSVTLYPRVSGYMDELKADIGDVVKKNQILAHIETPEQEEAYNSAVANAFNLRRIAARTKILRQRNLISQQQMEQAVSQAEVAGANAKTQKVLLSYQNVVAPFDGVISNRFVDPGWLLQNSSGSQAASQPMFVISKTDQLRLFIYVDQKDAPYVRVGDVAEIEVPNTTNSKQTAQVEMIAGELDPRTRTLLVEIILPNADQKIVAGSFLQVKLKVKTPSFLGLPIQALVMRKNESYVPVVGNGGHVTYKKIELVENDGERILIRSGVNVGEKVALNVGSTLTDGQKVQPSSDQSSKQQFAGTASMPQGGAN